MQTKWKILLFNLVSVCVVIIILWFVNISSFWSILSKIPIYYYLLFTGIYSVALIFRTDVWRQFFLKMGKSPNYQKLYFTIGIDWMANNFLPSRLGDLIGIEVITKSATISYGKSIGGITLIRLFDMVTLFVLMIGGLLYSELNILHEGLEGILTLNSGLILSILVSLGLILLLVAALILIFKYPKQIVAFANRISPKLGNFIEKLVDPLINGLILFRDQPQRGKFFIRILIENLFVWILDGVSICILCAILGLSINPLFCFIGILLTFILLPIPTTPSAWVFRKLFGPLLFLCLQRLIPLLFLLQSF